MTPNEQNGSGNWSDQQTQYLYNGQEYPPAGNNGWNSQQPQYPYNTQGYPSAGSNGWNSQQPQYPYSTQGYPSAGGNVSPKRKTNTAVIILCVLVALLLAAGTGLTFLLVVNNKKESDAVTELPAGTSATEYGDNAPTAEEEDLPRLADDADLLTDEEERRLRQELDAAREKLQLDLVIVTADSTEGKSSMEYADDYFDHNGYGCGPDNAGVLLLINMQEREWWISTTGYGITALTDYRIEQIGNTITPFLTDGEYYTAFSTFISLCDSYITTPVYD